MTTQPTRSDEKSKPRSADEIQADIQRTRQRLTENLEQLKAETSPAALKARAIHGAKRTFVDERTGAVRTERVIGVVVVIVGLVVVRRGIRSRARRRELERLSQIVWVPVPRAAVSAQVASVARDAAELAPGRATVPALTAA